MTGKEEEPRTAQATDAFNASTLSAELEPIARIIREFVGSAQDKLVLNYELTKNERFAIHSFVESLGLYSTSITLKGSNNKKIHLSRVPVYVDGDCFNSDDIDIFASGIGAPFPCTDPELREYYVDAFDPMFNTKESWELFAREELALRRTKSSINTRHLELVRRSVVKSAQIRTTRSSVKCDLRE